MAMQGLNSRGAFLSNQHHLTISCRSATSLYMGRRRTNFYKVLSLDFEAAGTEEIKKAYRAKARRCHPDVCPPSKKEESTRMFLEINCAYETLPDPVLRSRYDKELKMDGNVNGFMHPDLSRDALEAQLRELKKRSSQRQARSYRAS